MVEEDALLERLEQIRQATQSKIEEIRRLKSQKAEEKSSHELELNSMLDKILSGEKSTDAEDSIKKQSSDKDAQIEDLRSQLSKVLKKSDEFSQEKTEWKSRYYALMQKSIRYLSSHRDRLHRIEQRRADSYRRIKEEPMSNASYTHEYRFGRTTEKVKARFVEFIKEMYEDAIVVNDVYYLSKSTSATPEDEETILRRLLPIEYKNTGHKVIEINANGDWTTTLDRDEFIKYVTYSKD